MADGYGLQRLEDEEIARLVIEGLERAIGEENGRFHDSLPDHSTK